MIFFFFFGFLVNKKLFAFLFQDNMQNLVFFVTVIRNGVKIQHERAED